MKTKEHNITYMRFNELLQRTGDPAKIIIRSIHRAGFAKDNFELDNTRAAIRDDYDKARILNFIVSTEGTKRDGNQIDQSGWHLDNYRANPVFLWAHNGRDFPVGRAIDIWVGRHAGGRALKSRVEIMPEDLYVGTMGRGFTEGLLRAYNEGWMSAVSAGWSPIKWEWLKDEEGYIRGVNWLENDKVEHSAVPTPADPQALLKAIRSGTFTPEQLTSDYLKDEEDYEGRKVIWLDDRTPIETQAYSIPDPKILAETEKPTLPEPARDTHFDAEIVDCEFDPFLTLMNVVPSERAALYADDNTGLHHEMDGKVNRTALLQVAQRAMRGEYKNTEAVLEHIGQHMRKAEMLLPWECAMGRFYIDSNKNFREAEPQERLALAILGGADPMQRAIGEVGDMLFGTTRLPEYWEVSEKSEQEQAIGLILETANRSLLNKEEFAIFVDGYVRQINDMYSKQTEAYNFVQALMRKFEVKSTTELIERLEAVLNKPAEEAKEVVFSPDIEARLNSLAARVVGEKEEVKEDDTALMERILKLTKSISASDGSGAVGNR